VSAISLVCSPCSFDDCPSFRYLYSQEISLDSQEGDFFGEVGMVLGEEVCLSRVNIVCLCPRAHSARTKYLLL
jgi:hypothetical protein